MEINSFRQTFETRHNLYRFVQVFFLGTVVVQIHGLLVQQLQLLVLLVVIFIVGVLTFSFHFYFLPQVQLSLGIFKLSELAIYFELILFGDQP
jgi:hypothetical protein